MTRETYMAELVQLLQDLPSVEREAAIQYYNDYFEDAGVYKESEVIAELGSPKQVANIIKNGLKQTDTEEEVHSSKLSGGMIFLIVLLLLFLFPIGLLSSLLVIGLVILIFVCVILLAMITFLGGGVQFIGGILFIGSGIVKTFEILWGGLSMICGGIFLCGSGILFLAVSLWIVSFLLPWMFRLVTNMFHKKEKGGVNHA